MKVYSMDDDYRAQLIKLQNAFLEGTIDRETYEQFKAELKDSLKSQETLPTVEQVQGKTESQGPIAPPVENPFKKKGIANIRVEKQPALKPVPAPVRPASPINYGRKVDQEELVAEHDEETFIEFFSNVLRDPQVHSRATECAVYAALVVGMWQHFQLKEPVFQVGVSAGIAAVSIGGGCLLWIFLWRLSENFIERNAGVFSAVFWSVGQKGLLCAAAVFWLLIGQHFGILVGEIVGGRFGFLTAGLGAMIGSGIGLWKAWQIYRER